MCVTDSSTHRTSMFGAAPTSFAGVPTTTVGSAVLASAALSSAVAPRKGRRGAAVHGAWRPHPASKLAMYMESGSRAAAATASLLKTGPAAATVPAAPSSSSSSSSLRRPSAPSAEFDAARVAAQLTLLHRRKAALRGKDPLRRRQRRRGTGRRGRSTDLHRKTPSMMVHGTAPEVKLKVPDAARMDHMWVEVAQR